MKPASFFSIAIVCIFLSACNNDRLEEASSLEQQKIFDYLVDTYGFKAEDILLHEGRFIVENDTEFPIDGFWEQYGVSSPAEMQLHQTSEIAEDRRHRRHSYKITYAKNIAVNLRPGIPVDWVFAITQAAAEWNALGGGITFYTTNMDKDAYGAININMDPAVPSNLVAQTTFPASDGTPGRYMRVNPAYNYLSYNRKKFTIIHEMGHAMGFRHTDSNEGFSFYTTNACSSNPDPNSVMRSNIKDWVGFTSCDLYAFWALYP